LSGFDNRRTPLSDHLHDLFLVWTTEYVYVSDEFTLLFEEFELLGALAYLSIEAELSDLNSALNETALDHNFIWSPIGRVSWDRVNRDALFDGLRQKDKESAFLSAGFARGSAPYLTAAIKNLKRFCERISW
jgi:hypothetical protein